MGSNTTFPGMNMLGVPTASDRCIEHGWQLYDELIWALEPCIIRTWDLMTVTGRLCQETGSRRGKHPLMPAAAVVEDPTVAHSTSVLHSLEEAGLGVPQTSVQPELIIINGIKPKPMLKRMIQPPGPVPSSSEAKGQIGTYLSSPH